jgi:hypothetical protein
VIAELAVILVVVAVGLGVLSPLHTIPAPARAWMAGPTGGAVYMLASLLLVLLTGTLHPGAALGIAALLGLTGTVVAITRKSWDRRSLVWAGIAFAVTAMTVLLVRTIHLTRLTSDSLQYVAISTNLRLPAAADQVGPYFLLQRQMGLPSFHSLSELTDRRYLASIGPLFGVSCLGLFGWLTWRATRSVSWGRTLLVLAAGLLLVTSNRLIYHFFYINTHIQMATFVLIAIAGAWLALNERPAWAVPAGLALSATILLRPEAPLVVAIVLVALATTSASLTIRLAMTIPSVVIVALWYGGLLLHYARDTVVVLGNLAAVLAAALLTLLGGTDRFRNLVRHSWWLMPVTLTSALIALGIRNPDILVDSAIATSRNLTSEGRWLLTWPAVLVLGIIALLVHRIPEGRLWTTSIIGFGLLFWLLPLLREGAWRVGTGDSGNRILVHFLPVVVVFLVLAAVDRWPTSRSFANDEPNPNKDWDLEDDRWAAAEEPPSSRLISD